jgi:hypothetical protein
MDHPEAAAMPLADAFADPKRSLTERAHLGHALMLAISGRGEAKDNPQVMRRMKEMLERETVSDISPGDQERVRAASSVRAYGAEILGRSYAASRHSNGRIDDVESSLPILRKLAEGQEPAPRLAALSALGTLGPEAKPALPSLERALAHAREYYEFTDPFEAAWRIGGRGAFEDLLKGKSENVRFFAVMALGRVVGHYDARRLLQDLSERDPSPEIRERAGKLLRHWENRGPR